MIEPESALAVCRFVHDGATMSLWGSFAYLAALVPRDLAAETGRRLRAFGVSGIAVAVSTTIAMLPIAVAAIGNGWGDALDPATIEAVLFETSVGTALLIQLALAAALAGTLVVPALARNTATALASGLLLASLALTGHAVMDEGWFGIAHQANDAAHVLAGGAWLGALVPLLAIFRMSPDPGRRAEAGVALKRFSTAAHGAVALVIATGAANTAFVLKRWPLSWSSPYQALLMLKIVVVLIMTGLAVANRYLVVPRIAVDRAGATRALRVATFAEIALGMVALGCVSVFGLLEPA